MPILFIILLTLSFTSAQPLGTELPDAYLPPRPEARIFPKPQESVFLPEGYRLTPGTVLYLRKDTPALRLAATSLQDDIQARYGFRPPLQIGDGVGIGDAGITIGTQASGVRSGAAPVERAEGYTLESIPKGVTIVGFDERGAFYGVQSLRGLLGERAELPGLQVRDYPTHPLRLAMLYLDADSDEVNLKLLPLLAQYKFNAVLVMSNYIEWESAPELHVPGSASKEAARRLVETARAHLIEPVPLLETLGHSGWLFANGANRDLLPDRSVAEPWAYDPLNPRVYEVLEPLLDELLDLFQPRFFHVGHDEVRAVNPFPGNDAGRELGFGALFLMDTLRLHDYLASRGVRTVLWHDELLSADVSPLLSEFPKDMLVTVWNYRPAADYPDLERLQEADFEVLGATWSDPEAITLFARDAAETGALGMVQTRWTGYFGNASALYGQYDQFYAYLSAANAFWNPSAPPLRDAPARFYAHWIGQDSVQQRSGRTIDLSGVANVPAGKALWGLEPGYALAIEDNLRGLGVRFDLTGAVTVQGSHRRTRTAPRSVTLPLGRAAGSLAFLQTTGWSVPAGTEVGHYLVHYAGGAVERVPLVYGTDLSTWTDTEISSIELLQGWRGETVNGLPVGLNVLFWTNPRPTEPIDRLEFVSEGTIASPALLALTAID